MNAQSPTISAIVPVHNGAAYIAEALASIQTQDHPVSEIIVVDDGSVDGTADIVRSVAPEARLIQQPQVGPAGARNAGADTASGELLAFLDHDDLWPPDRTRALLQGLAATPEAGMICGRVRFLEMPGVSRGLLHARMEGHHMLSLVQAALIRREVWMAAGGMDVAYQWGEDFDLYLRLIDASVLVATVEQTTVIYRRHASNRTRDAQATADAKLTSLRSAIHRRRGTAP